MRPEPDAAPAAPAILIVDDNQVNALILSTMLRKQGYAAEVARSGAEGVAMTVRRPARLILMDLQMPQLDGFAAAAADPAGLQRRDAGDGRGDGERRRARWRRPARTPASPGCWPSRWTTRS